MCMLSSLDFAYAHMCIYVVSHASHSREKVSLLTLSSEAGEKVDETTLQHKRQYLTQQPHMLKCNIKIHVHTYLHVN